MSSQTSKPAGGRRQARGPGGAARADSRAGAIEARRDGACITLTLSRPARRNRLSAAMGSRLIELAEEIEDDDAIRLVILTGAGGAFCAGFDPDVAPATVESLAVVSKPTLALIDGDCLDEGLELAMAMDLRAAVAGARFALTQLKRGSLPHFGGSQRLSRLIGGGQALRMILSGEAIDAGEALRLGLITYLAAGRRELKKCAARIGAAIASRGPIAARLAKETVLKGYDMTLEQGIRLEEDLYALLQTTSDRAEGISAFLEKRKPLFKGT